MVEAVGCFIDLRGDFIDEIVEFFVVLISGIDGVSDIDQAEGGLKLVREFEVFSDNLNSFVSIFGVVESLI